MKKLHYPLLMLLLIAIIGLPGWYAIHGGSAESVPGTGDNAVLRSKDGRGYVGGGPRSGK